MTWTRRAPRLQFCPVQIQGTWFNFVEYTPEYKVALIAWCKYRTATEVYDRGVSPIRDEKGNAIVYGYPNAFELSNAFALQCRDRYLKNLDGDLSQKAKMETGHWSHEKMLDFVNDDAHETTRTR